MPIKYYQEDIENTLFEQTSVSKTNDNPGGNQIMNIANKRPIAFKISKKIISHTSSLTVTSFIYIHWLKSYKGSK